MRFVPLAPPAKLRPPLLILLVSALGCTGQSTLELALPPGAEAEPSGAPEVPDAPPAGPVRDTDFAADLSACDGPVSPGRTPLRHLTNVEYDNSVSDLLGVDVRPSTRFPADTGGFGFANNADTYSISTVHVERYLEAAEKLSASANLTALLPCSPTAGNQSCAEDFIEQFGRKAYRRPLTVEDRESLRTVFAAGNQVDFATGIRLVIQVVLQSADFLYRPELGIAAAPGTVIPLTDHEMASRLSYFLWQSPPDETLARAADEGQLSTPEQVEAQARRMLADARARPTVVAFHMQWLELNSLDGIEKDPALYPNFATLRPLMKKEASLFFESVLTDPNADVTTLFTSNSSYMNKALATFYGITGPSGSTFEKVQLDPSQRLGFLTQAALMAVNATTRETHPVIRGKFVRERLLCQHLPPPPEDLALAAPDPSPELTTRERYAEHSSNAACSGCHVLMDPIGFGFENYDAVGAFRASENDRPVDASGELTGTLDADGTFNGAVELAAMLADSSEVKDCLTTQWFRFANSREESSADSCSIAMTRKAFADSGHRISELIVSLTQTDSFLYRKAVAPGGVE